MPSTSSRRRPTRRMLFERRTKGTFKYSICANEDVQGSYFMLKRSEYVTPSDTTSSRSPSGVPSEHCSQARRLILIPSYLFPNSTASTDSMIVLCVTSSTHPPGVCASCTTRTTRLDISSGVSSPSKYVALMRSLCPREASRSNMGRYFSPWISSLCKPWTAAFTVAHPNQRAPRTRPVSTRGALPAAVVQYQRAHSVSGLSGGPASNPNSKPR